MTLPTASRAGALRIIGFLVAVFALCFLISYGLVAFDFVPL